jgi:hypothetical protein
MTGAQAMPNVNLLMTGAPIKFCTQCGRTLPEPGALCPACPQLDARRRAVVLAYRDQVEALRDIDAADNALALRAGRGQGSGRPGRRDGGGGAPGHRGEDRPAADLRPRPDFVIVLTDGHAPWPRRAPDGMRVVVGLMDADGRTPDWATTVLVDADATGGLR